jgi:hypothetical protein
VPARELLDGSITTTSSLDHPRSSSSGWSDVTYRPHQNGFRAACFKAPCPTRCAQSELIFPFKATGVGADINHKCHLLMTSPHGIDYGRNRDARNARENEAACGKFHSVMRRRKPNPAEPATDRAEFTNPREYLRATMANQRCSNAQRPDPITGAANRTTYGVESGPWIGRVPDGWLVSELARVRSGPGQGDLLFMREGSLLLYPSGWLWLDHAALGCVLVGSAGKDQPEEVTDTQLPRSQRRMLTTLRIGFWTFTVGHPGLARLQAAFGTIPIATAEADYLELRDALPGEAGIPLP